MSSNTTVRNTGSIGILINPAAGAVAGQRIDATFHNVRVQNSSIGVAIGNSARVMISQSVLTGNSGPGIRGRRPTRSLASERQ